MPLYVVFRVVGRVGVFHLAFVLSKRVGGDLRGSESVGGVEISKKPLRG